MKNCPPDATATDTMANACFNYLVGNPEELARFMVYSGMDGDALRRAMGSRDLALGLMDYFAQNESALLAMTANSGIGTEQFMRIWHTINPQA